ncbi:MAG: hypothetical protein NTV51_11400 [Verrucomicrobia bacterium]|nr:hypothetical protein [Verrucomicrobiota bacterium]
MNTTTRFLALAALFLSVTLFAAAGDKSLEQARRAQALLGPEVWSQVIRVENDTRTERSVAGGELRNGCFIESVVALRDRLLRGGEALRPQLLSYYINTRNGQQGHTVLAYEAAGRVEVIDSAQAGKRFAFPTTVAGDALKLARELQGPAVGSARLFPIDWPAARAGRYSDVSTAPAATAISG